MPRTGGTTLSLICARRHNIDQLRDQALVERRRRNDDAIERQEPVGALVHRVQLERVALRDDLDVDVREELELAPTFRHRALQSPINAVRSGGVTRRQIHRAATRNANTATAVSGGEDHSITEAAAAAGRSTTRTRAAESRP